MSPTLPAIRLLPDGTRLRNRLLAALPTRDYARIQKHLHMNTAVLGRTLQAHGTPVTDVYFPNGGVFSVTNECVTARSLRLRPSAAKACSESGCFLVIAREQVECSSRCPTGHSHR